MLFDFMEWAISFPRDNSTVVDELTLALLTEEPFLHRWPLAWTVLVFMETDLS